MTKRKVLLLILLIIFFRLFSIYATLQTSILSYRSIEIQPIIENEVITDIGNSMAEETTESTQISESVEDTSRQDALESSLEDVLNTIYDPITDTTITIEAFNLYTFDELMHFKGIGEKTAQAIIEYQKQNGEFSDFKELLQVKGIGEKKLEQMRNGK